jgi:hypothetical protein
MGFGFGFIRRVGSSKLSPHYKQSGEVYYKHSAARTTREQKIAETNPRCTKEYFQILLRYKTGEKLDEKEKKWLEKAGISTTEMDKEPISIPLRDAAVKAGKLKHEYSAVDKDGNVLEKGVF